MFVDSLPYPHIEDFKSISDSMIVTIFLNTLLPQNDHGNIDADSSAW